MNETTNEQRGKILEIALRNVAFDGWGKTLLQNAIKEAGLSAEEGARLFPGGIAELTDAFSLHADQEMERQLEAEGLTLKSLGVGRFVGAALRKRFEVLAGDKEAVRRSLGFLMLPTNTALALKLTHRTVDRVWKLSGVHSTDFSHYTRRMTLGGVLLSTTLYWLVDKSENSEATWTFMNRRLIDVVRFSQVKEKVMGVFTPLKRPSTR